MPDRPNFVWISNEDTVPLFGAYGDEIARTPTMDQLAEEGVRYPNACTTAGVCAPSRAAIITGCYQTRLGAHHMKPSFDLPLIDDDEDPHPDEWGYGSPYATVPPHYIRAVPEMLRRAGYFCTNNGKTHYQFQAEKTPATLWDRNDYGSSEWDAHWRDRPSTDQPFFSVFNLDNTHEGRMRRSEADGPTTETDPSAVQVPPYLPDTPRVREEIARHYDNLATNDALATEIISQLEEDGELENTYIFLWSDHGWGLPRCKRFLYDGGINVGLTVRGPGQPAGTVRDAPISMVDLAPTLLELAGEGIPQWMDGQPFIGDGPDVSEREYAFAARDRHDENYDMVRAVRSSRYKCIRNYYPEQPPLGWVSYRTKGAPMRELLRLYAEDSLHEEANELLDGGRPPEELYDLDADPHEVDNLAADPEYHDVLEDHRHALDKWQVRTDDQGHEMEQTTSQRMHGYGFEDVDGNAFRETAPPVIVPNTASNRERHPVQGSVEIEGPATVVLAASTQGASIAYRLNHDESETSVRDESTWDVYAGRIRLPEGRTTIEAKAVRYGYLESPIRTATISVSG